MNHKKILTKAIEKAIAGGYRHENTTSAVTLLRLSTYIPEAFIYNHDFAKALWGEYSEQVPEYHVTLSVQPGYVSTLWPTTNSEGIKTEKEHDYKCFSCGKVLGGNYWVKNEVCWYSGVNNLGWELHLQNIVVAPDSIEYLGKNLPN